MADIDLLSIEIATLWLKDERGRLVRTRQPNGTPAPHLVIAVAGDAQRMAFGSQVPEPVARGLQAVIMGAPAPAERTQPSDSIRQAMEVLHDSLGPVVLSTGPTYVIPSGTTFPSTANVVRSDRADVSHLRGRLCDLSNWDADDWHRLLDGDLGPWAIATIGGRIGAVCHCARLSDDGAEAGVWTHPDFRGHGLAAAATAAWASLLAPSGRVLFYSTSSTNLSSQGVAARLGLRSIGWLWQTSPAEDRCRGDG